MKALYYFLITDDFIIATPDCIASSKNTQDVSLFELAENYELQRKLGLLTHVLIKPESPWSTPASTEKCRKGTALYLTEFVNSADKLKRLEYLLNNGMLRILWKK